MNTNPDSKHAPIKDLDFTLDLPPVIHATTLIIQSWGMMVAASWVWSSVSNCCQRASGLPFRDPTIGQSEIKPGRKPGTAWSLVFLPHSANKEQLLCSFQPVSPLLQHQVNIQMLPVPHILVTPSSGEFLGKKKMSEAQREDSSDPHLRSVHINDELEFWVVYLQDRQEEIS